jgi:hypothetical protein
VSEVSQLEGYDGEAGKVDAGPDSKAVLYAHDGSPAESTDRGSAMELPLTHGHAPALLLALPK